MWARTSNGLPTLLAMFWVGFIQESGWAAGVPSKGPGGPSGVNFATHHSRKIRAGAHGAWPLSNWLGALSLSSA